ncbi:MAG: xylulose kinase [Promethearchaeota archaeon]|nr:MAG: xylulose kinase [Candidatus Lokiarchaeota archaeon]
MLIRLKQNQRKPKKYIIAVDHGTSGVKVAIISVYGEIVCWEFEKTPLYLIHDNGAEQNPDEWWSAFLIATKRLIAKISIPFEDLVAISVSGQWSCTVALDAEGNHLMNAISWLDSRGAPYIQKKMKGLINVSGYGLRKVLMWISKTGGGPTLTGKDPISHILFIKNEHPEIYEKTYKFLDNKDYMNFKLTGKFAATYDSIHLHWVTNSQNLNNIYYDDSLIKILGVDKAKFPYLLKSTDVLGTLRKEVAEELGIPKSIKLKVMGGSGDLQMAAIGSGAVKDFEGHIYLGTSSFVICHSPKKTTDLFHNIAAIPSANPEKYFIASEQDTAGACLTFLRDKFLNFHAKEEKSYDYAELDRIAEKIPAGSKNLIFTPWLYGERTPIDDPTVRGGFHNLSLDHNFDIAVRAVFEGVALNSRWVLKYVEKLAGKKLDPLNIIGGGAVSDVWCQIYADVLNRTIRRVKNPIQSNAKGAAFVASVGLGYITFEDIAQLTEISHIFEPNPENRAIYDKLFKQFVEIYKKNRKIYRNLNLNYKEF